MRHYSAVCAYGTAPSQALSRFPQENNHFIAFSPGDQHCGSHKAAVGSAGCISSGLRWGAVFCPPFPCWLSPGLPPRSLGGAPSPPPAPLPVSPHAVSEAGLQILHPHLFVLNLLKSINTLQMKNHVSDDSIICFLLYHN